MEGLEVGINPIAAHKNARGDSFLVNHFCGGGEAAACVTNQCCICNLSDSYWEASIHQFTHQYS